MVHIYHGILVSPKEMLGYKICRKLDGSVKYYSKRSKSMLKRNTLYIL